MVYNSEDNKSFIWIFYDKKTGDTRMHWGTYDFTGQRAYKGSTTLSDSEARFFLI